MAFGTRVLPWTMKKIRWKKTTISMFPVLLPPKLLSFCGHGCLRVTMCEFSGGLGIFDYLWYTLSIEY